MIRFVIHGILLMAIPAIGLGFGRFAYTLVLPEMIVDLGWDHATAGWMNGVNALGYLVGALVASSIAAKVGSLNATIGGLVGTAVGLLLTGLGGEQFIFAGRLIAGLGGAVSFVAGGGIVMASITSKGTLESSLALCIYCAGAGLGILISAVAVPLVHTVGGNWQSTWLFLAGISALATGPVAGHLAQRSSPRAPAVSVAAPFLPMTQMLAAYCAFGLGYAGYMTFVIMIVRETWNSPVLDAVVWAIIGISAIASPQFWSRLIDQIPPQRATAVLVATIAVGATLPIVSTSFPVVALSAAMFGSALFCIVAGVSAFLKRSLAPAYWTKALGIFTVSFGVGQTFGPYFAGILSDMTGQPGSVLWLSASFLAVAAILAWSQPNLIAQQN